jgi:Zn-dependent protease with chaperone function
MIPSPLAILQTACMGAAFCCRPGFWALVVVVSLIWITTLGLLAALARTAWLGAKVHRALARLPHARLPMELAEAAARAGVTGVECLVDSRPQAFCAGLLRPRIYVTTGLQRHLHGPELDAVLVHEGEHARRRDPLRRAFGHGAAEVFFFVPLVWWLAKHERENAEMRADRLAMRRVGRIALAAALLVLGDRDGSGAVAAFAGEAQLRVAQILGDPLPQRRPATWQWAVSILGVAGALYLTFCPTGGLLSQ